MNVVLYTVSVLLLPGALLLQPSGLFAEGVPVSGYQAREFEARGQYYLNLGSHRQELRDFEGALGDYTSALELNPRFHHAFVARGSVLCEMEREADAGRDFARAAELGGNGLGVRTAPSNCRDWRERFRGSEVTRSNRAWYPGR